MLRVAGGRRRLAHDVYITVCFSFEVRHDGAAEELGVLPCGNQISGPHAIERSQTDRLISAQDPKDMEILRLRRENAKLRAALVDDGMRL